MPECISENANCHGEVKLTRYTSETPKPIDAGPDWKPYTRDSYRCAFHRDLFGAYVVIEEETS